MQQKKIMKKKQKEIEEIVTPIIQKLGGGMGGMGGMGGFNPEDFQNFSKKDDDEKKEDDEKKKKMKKAT